jgi:HAD superfamily hydrolase (TIGR01549 family)
LISKKAIDLSDPSPVLRYVLFDLGSTLVYFQGDGNEVMEQGLLAAAQTLRSLGYPLEESSFAKQHSDLMRRYYRQRDIDLIEYGSKDILRELLREHGYPQVPEDHVTLTLKNLYAYPQQFYFVEDEAVTVLEALKSAGLNLGIVSNAADNEDVQMLVDQAGLRPYFDFVLTSSKFGVRKPSPAIFLTALSFWQAHPRQAAMVGDNLFADVVGAQALGMMGIWYRKRANLKESRPLLNHARPNAVIDRLSELLKLFQFV